MASGLYNPIQLFLKHVKCTHLKCVSTHGIWPLQPNPTLPETCQMYTSKMCLNTQHLASILPLTCQMYTPKMCLNSAGYQHTASGLYSPTQLFLLPRQMYTPRIFSTHSIWPLQPYPTVFPCQTYTPQNMSLYTALAVNVSDTLKDPPKHTDSGSPVLLNWTPRVLFGSNSSLTESNP